jgi:hypothetical protein
MDERDDYADTDSPARQPRPLRWLVIAGILIAGAVSVGSLAYWFVETFVHTIRE